MTRNYIPHALLAQTHPDAGQRKKKKSLKKKKKKKKKKYSDLSVDTEEREWLSRGGQNEW